MPADKKMKKHMKEMMGEEKPKKKKPAKGKSKKLPTKAGY